MADTVGLSLLLEANIQQFDAAMDHLEAGVNEVNSSVGSLTGSAASLSGSLNSLSPVTAAAAAGVTNLSRAVNSGNATLRGISVTAQYADRQIESLATSAQRVVRPTVNANGALSGFNNIIRDAPFGIIGIGNNITQLVDAFGQLRQQTGSNSAALRVLASSVFGPAGLLTIGLSSAISLWTAYSMRQQQAKAKSDEAAKTIKSQADILKETTRNTNQYNASAIAEIATLTRLYNVAADDVRSRKDRLAALKELKSQTNGYLSDLKLETIQSDAARESLDKYNASLFNSALIKAYQGKVENLAKAYTYNKEQADKGRKSIDEFDASMQRQRDRINKGLLSGGELDQAQSKIMKNEANRNKLVASTNTFIKAQNAAYDEILATGKQIADLKVAVNPFSKGSDKQSSGTSADSVLKGLRLELSAIDSQAALTGATFDSVAKDKITALQKAFEDLIKLGLKPTSPEIQNIATQMNNLGDKILGDTPIVTKLVQSLGKQVRTTKVKTLTPDELADVLGIPRGSQLQLDTKIVPPIVFEETPGLENLDKAAPAFAAKVGQMAADAKDAFNQNFIQWGNALNQGLGPAIVDLGAQVQSAVAGVATGIGDSIGNLITGKESLHEALNSMVGIMADFVVSFGKALIEAATLKIIAMKTLIANPWVALAAGVAAVAVGQALKQKAPHFATGGTVTEPTLAMIGDNPSGVEHVIPQEVLDRLDGGSGALQGQFLLKGTDLLAIVERTKKEQNRF